MTAKTLDAIDCGACGKTFVPTAANQKYCPECRGKGYKWTAREARAVRAATRRTYAVDYDVGVQVLTTPCVNCGKPLKYVMYRNQDPMPPKYCSRACRTADHAKSTYCCVCGKPMLETGQRVDVSGKPWTCSPECAEARAWELARARGTVGECPVCGREFIRKGERKYCSQACYRKHVADGKTERDAARERARLAAPAPKEDGPRARAPGPEREPRCVSTTGPGRSRPDARPAGTDRGKASEAGRAKDREYVLSNGLCGVCTVPYCDCERMSSGFRSLPEGAFQMDGKVVSCPRFKSKALKHALPEDFDAVAAMARKRNLERLAGKT